MTHKPNDATAGNQIVMQTVDSHEPRVRRHVRIIGQVQGVSFRASIADRARTFGVDGFARNLEDGSVDAVFEGPEQSVEELLEFCQRGPAHARVREMQVEHEPPLGVRGFEVG
jgi:acylphosphatase